MINKVWFWRTSSSVSEDNMARNSFSHNSKFWFLQSIRIEETFVKQH